MILVIKRAIEAARLKRENEELRVRRGQRPRADRQPVLINQLRHAIERGADQ